VQTLGYHCYTLWLFTVSDHKSFMLPLACAGLFNFIAGATLNATSIHTHSVFHTLSRVPAVFFWVWLNLLIACIGNQRRPSSVSEDAINKPWRPIPSGRLSPENATSLWKAVHLVAPLLCAYLGALPYTISLLVMGYLYNVLDGADHLVFRNLLNACAAVAFVLGGTNVAYAGEPFALNTSAVQWHCMICGILFSSIQIQDLRDQEGDKERGRSTVPILLGDSVGRWTVVLSMLTWSIAVPFFWKLPWWGFLGPCSVGATVCGRLLTMKDVPADKKSYNLWGLWVFSLLATPTLAVTDPAL
jgi:4-hydroxybenzoate polyprenyltransferase